MLTSIRTSLALLLCGFSMGCAPERNSPALTQPLKTHDSEQAKIIGGYEASTQDDWSRMVVGIWMGDEKVKYICSGTLISDQLAITAAHCIEQANLESLDVYVVFSRNAFTNSPNKRRKVQNSVIHPNYYNSSVKYADIALIQFTGGLPKGYQPAPLLPKAAAKNVLQSGQEAFMAGYGVNFYESNESKGGEGYLRGVKMPIGSSSADSDRVIFENKNGKCTSLGDSGGPGLVIWSGEWHLWGVNSYRDETKILKSGCTIKSGAMQIPHFERWLKRSAKALAPDSILP